MNAVIYLHEQGVMHRNIKASNVILLETETLEWDVKLADYGNIKSMHSSTVTKVQHPAEENSGIGASEQTDMN